jgi:hypothetical protein
VPSATASKLAVAEEDALILLGVPGGIVSSIPANETREDGLLLCDPPPPPPPPLVVFDMAALPGGVKSDDKYFSAPSSTPIPVPAVALAACSTAAGIPSDDDPPIRMRSLLLSS